MGTLHNLQSHPRKGRQLPSGLLLVPLLLSAAVAVSADFSINRASWTAQTNPGADFDVDFCSGNPDAAAQAVWAERPAAKGDFSNSSNAAGSGAGYWTYSRWESSHSVEVPRSVALVSWHSESGTGLEDVPHQQIVSALPDDSLDGAPAYSWSCLGQSDAAGLWPVTLESDENLILAPADAGDRVFKEAWVIRFEAPAPRPGRVEQSDDPNGAGTG